MDFNTVELTLNEQFERTQNALLTKYEPLFEKVSRSDNFTLSGRPFTRLDGYNLGMQLEQYKKYENFVAESASAADLGMLPKVPTDVIAASYAISVAPLLASMQTIPEQQGIIYFKRVTAAGMVSRHPYTTDPNGASNGLGDGFGPQSRGGLDVGDPLVDALRGRVGDAMQYATEQVMGEVIEGISGDTIDTQVRMFPIRGNIPVRITYVNGTTVREGTFMNRGGGGSNVGVLMSSDGFWTGTIEFSTGHISVKAADDLSAGQVTVNYMQDFETAADIPVIEMTLSSTDVMAEVLALKQNISTLKAFQFNQRFGRIAEDDALMDLAGTMADVESRRILAGYVQMANWIERQDFSSGREIRFNLSTPAGQSDYEYRQGFRYPLVTADSEINLNCGRGAANRYIAGHKGCEFISSLPKFEAAPANTAVGPHVFGYYDGKPVIRTTYLTGFRDPESGANVHPANVIIAGYLNPQSPFDAPIVEATYMPIFITNPMQFSHNPFQNMRGIAAWKAFKNVVPHYVKGMILQNAT